MAHISSWQMDAQYLEMYVCARYGHLDATAFGTDQVAAVLDPHHKRAPRVAEKLRGVLLLMFNIATRGSRRLGDLSGRTRLPPDSIKPASRVMLSEGQTTSHSPM